MDQKINFIFLLGVIFGLILKWSDIIPIAGGFILGLCCYRIPDLINVNDYVIAIKENVDSFSSNLRKKTS